MHPSQYVREREREKRQREKKMEIQIQNKNGWEWKWRKNEDELRCKRIIFRLPNDTLQNWFVKEMRMSSATTWISQFGKLDVWNESWHDARKSIQVEIDWKSPKTHYPYMKTMIQHETFRSHLLSHKWKRRQWRKKREERETDTQRERIREKTEDTNRDGNRDEEKKMKINMKIQVQRKIRWTWTYWQIAVPTVR